MSTTDKTRQKLLNSMRKTKADAESKPAPAPKKTAATRAQGKPAASKKTTASRAKASAGQATQAGADPYQSGRRVWPD